MESADGWGIGGTGMNTTNCLFRGDNRRILRQSIPLQKGRLPRPVHRPQDLQNGSNRPVK